ncbi:MAG: ankyrin repeat domain-containing protein [Bacteroidales bacterium]|nr:ankyrin repeat domain-containing protein [Bacteroidales bacterium]MCF8332820.1 ankyrin repeat domain-containing protein [Bacteroidales bacterium]
MELSYRGRGVFLIIIFVFISITSFADSPDDREVLRTIRKGNITKLQSFISNGLDVNKIYDDRTLLNYAIRKDEYAICKELVKAGADINRFHDDRSPLIQAVRTHNFEILEWLIGKGAKLDLADSNGNTALTYAVQREKLDMVKLLFESGSSSAKKNNRGKTPFEYVNRYHENPVLEYINKIKVLKHHMDTLPDMVDGPHVQLKEDYAKVTYFLHDSSRNKTWKRYNHYPLKEKTLTFEGFAGDTNTYHLDLDFKEEPPLLSGVEKMFLIGDVHGEIETVLELLKSQQIIKSSGEWNFGEGHLIFNGDVFDRGTKVTETLWLIHRLKRQAIKNGGDVHLLLGNHEIMALTGDYSYLAPKYLYFSQFFFKKYKDWYNRKSYMGQWLHHRNVTMKIDDKLLVHAGFSPRVLNQKLSLKEINDIFQLHMRGKRYRVEYIHKLVVSGDGPLWYRGYAANNRTYTEVEATLVNKTLDFYSASRLIVGHMPHYTIKSMYDSKVYLIDVPVGKEGYLAQGLLIDGQQFYKCSKNGRCIKIE